MYGDERNEDLSPETRTFGTLHMGGQSERLMNGDGQTSPSFRYGYGTYVATYVGTARRSILHTSTAPRAERYYLSSRTLPTLFYSVPFIV